MKLGELRRNPVTGEIWELWMAGVSHGYLGWYCKGRPLVPPFGSGDRLEAFFMDDMLEEWPIEKDWPRLNNYPKPPNECCTPSCRNPTQSSIVGPHAVGVVYHEWCKSCADVMAKKDASAAESRIGGSLPREKPKTECMVLKCRRPSLQSQGEFMVDFAQCCEACAEDLASRHGRTVDPPPVGPLPVPSCPNCAASYTVCPSHGGTS